MHPTVSSPRSCRSRSSAVGNGGSPAVTLIRTLRAEARSRRGITRPRSTCQPEGRLAAGGGIGYLPRMPRPTGVHPMTPAEQPAASASEVAPYFDVLLRRLADGDPRATEAFGRHV